MMPQFSFTNCVIVVVKMPKKNSDGGEPKPASNFVHLSYKSLTDYEDLRKGEDIYYAQILRTFSFMLAACAMGAYVAAKSFFFQDRIGAAVICMFLTVLLANSPVMNQTRRSVLLLHTECLGIHFFSGCCISTVLWWNFSFNHWNIVRVLSGLAMAPFLYQLPNQLFCFLRNMNKTSDKNRRVSKDCNRLVFGVLGPVTVYGGLLILDLITQKVMGTPLLQPEWRAKVTLVFGVWAMYFGQYLFAKARLYDHDVFWQIVLMFPETLLSLFMVPKTILNPTEDDY
eukprot:sb/3467790/